MGFSFYEQETVITFNRAEDTAQIYTADPVMIRKLDNLRQKTSVVTVKNETESSKTYILPKKFIRVQKPPERSEEQKQAAAERLQKMRGEKT